MKAIVPAKKLHIQICWLYSINTNLDIDIRSTIKQKIQIIDISEIFGITIPKYNSHGDGYYKIFDNAHIAKYGSHNRRVSWSDYDRQPDNEWLYVLSFPIGAYIFDESYPTTTFNKFFNELKTFEPKYVDTVNNVLYFSYDNAKVVHNKYDEIFIKYKKMVDIELNERKIKELEAKLAELKS